MRKNPLDEIGTREVGAFLRNRLALMLKGAEICSQYFFNVTDAYWHGSPHPTDLRMARGSKLLRLQHLSVCFDSRSGSACFSRRKRRRLGRRECELLPR